MSRIFRPSVPLGSRRPFLEGSQALETRVRLVLQTRRGQLPWRPEFGCDLASLAGEPATRENLGRARYLVQSAITRWIPDVRVRRCAVTIERVDSGMSRDLPLPVAERVLLALGPEVHLRVHLDLETRQGAEHVEALVHP